MIAGFVLATLGALAIVLALLEVASLFVDGLGTIRILARKLTWHAAPESEMQNAMFWIQVGGLFLVGAAMLAAGLASQPTSG